jgi:hypothetical protein
MQEARRAAAPAGSTWPRPWPVWQLALESRSASRTCTHRFCRSFADKWLATDGSTDDLMHITGWKTYEMVHEYTEAAALPAHTTSSLA